MRDHPRVTRFLPERPYVRVLLRGFLAPLGRFRVQFQHQPVRGRPQLPERQRPRHPSQHGIGLGRVLIGQDPGLLFDDPQVNGVDRARAQRGKGRWQPAAHRAGVVHLRAGRGHGQMQLVSQLVGGKFRRDRPLGGRPGGELGDGGQHVPRGARFQSATRRDDADQLVIRHAGQALPVLPGDGVDNRGQQRVRRHVRGRAGLGELVGIQRPGGQAQEQPLPRELVRKQAVIRLLLVVAGIGERVSAHAPRSVRKKDLKPPIHTAISYLQSKSTYL
jgi:hypothetical protein